MTIFRLIDIPESPETRAALGVDQGEKQ